MRTRFSRRISLRMGDRQVALFDPHACPAIRKSSSVSLWAQENPNNVLRRRSRENRGRVEKTGAFSPPRFPAPAFKSSLLRARTGRSSTSANFYGEQGTGEALLLRRCRVAVASVNNKEPRRMYCLINQEDAAAAGWN